MPLWMDSSGRLAMYADNVLKNCECKTCPQFIMDKKELCDASGYPYLHDTGYLFSLTDAEAEIRPVIFLWIEWTMDGGVCRAQLNALDCDCNRFIVEETDFSGETPAGIEDFGYSFISHARACEEFECNITIMAFMRRAIANGWELHGNGVVIRKNDAQKTCYRFPESSSGVYAWVDTGTEYRYISCDCYESSISGTSYELSDIIDYNICECYDIREILLAYPEKFGVLDVSFGDDTVVKTTSSSQSVSYDDMLDTNSYCDYRNMYVIIDNSAVGEERDERPYDVPQWILYKFYAERTLYGRVEQVSAGYGSAEFVGKIAPFSSTDDNNARWPNSNLSWKGTALMWVIAPGYGSDADWEVARLSSKSDAEAELARYRGMDNKYGNLGFDAISSQSTAVSFGPVSSFQTSEGEVVYSDEDYMWHVIRPHYVPPEDGRLYCLNTIHTSKGYLVNGGGGFTECVTVLGTGSAASPLMCVYYQSCEDYGHDPDESRIEHASSNPYCFNSFDTTWCCDIYDDMGGCRAKEWWDAIMEQYEEEENEQEGE